MSNQLLQYGPYVVPTHNTYFIDYYYKTKAFDDFKIQKIENYVNSNLNFQNFKYA